MDLPGSHRSHGRHAFVGLLVILLLAGCSDLLPSPYEYATVEVQATRRSGEPVPGVKVVLYTYNRHLAYGVTGSGGSYTFDFVPFGEYGVGVVPPDGYEVLAGKNDVVGIEITRGAQKTVPFTILKHGNGTIHVRAEEPSGQPVPGVALTLYSHRGTVAEGVADSEGRYSFQQVPFGQYGVRAGPLVGYTLVTRFVDGIDVEDGSEETVTLTLERCDASIRVLTADRTGNGISGVPLVLYTSQGPVLEGTTDERGAHEFLQVACGVQYGVRVELPPGLVVEGGGRSFVDGIEVSHGSEETVSFRLEPCYGSLSVQVADRAGGPVPDADLVLYTSRGLVAEGSTDAQGQYAFAELPCDQYGVRVTPPTGYVAQSGSGTSYVDGIDIGNGTQKTARLVVDKQ
jgi:hypothetical protein